RPQTKHYAPLATCRRFEDVHTREPLPRRRDLINDGRPEIIGHRPTDTHLGSRIGETCPMPVERTHPTVFDKPRVSGQQRPRAHVLGRLDETTLQRIPQPHVHRSTPSECSAAVETVGAATSAGIVVRNPASLAPSSVPAAADLPEASASPWVASRPGNSAPPSSLNSGAAFTTVSSYSSSESDSATIAPPTPYRSVSPRTTRVRMTTLRSTAPFSEKYPKAPLYAPLGPDSRSSMIPLVRSFGAPVIEPGGNAACTHATGLPSRANRELTVDTI